LANPQNTFVPSPKPSTPIITDERCVSKPFFRAIENGANTLAEGFLFTVAAALILGETWRTSRNQSKRRDNVDEQLDILGTNVKELSTRIDGFAAQWEDRLREEVERYVNLALVSCLFSFIIFFYDQQ
jgi:hypothetical protein